jgi:phosphoribosylamine--glycine ligase
MAAKGYPGDYEKGSIINGLDSLPETSSEMTFHAGTTEQNGQITATGGRVLNITARGATLQDAHARAYAMIAQIDWPEGFYRTDIGHRAL